jgi:hypothetical protein
VYRATIAALSVLVLWPSPVPQVQGPDLVKLQPGETPVPGECLTKQELDLIRQLHDLKRPTIGREENGAGDDQPPFNPHYLVGRWSVEGQIPESPLGAAGEVTGVETVRRVDACAYEAVLDARGPDGPFKVGSTIVYDPKAKYMIRLERDSRGFELVKTGSVGGDAGGYFTHFWEAPEFTFKGARVRLKGTTFFSSPSNYRLRTQLSVQAQPFVNFGTMWWRRDQGAAPLR